MDIGLCKISVQMEADPQIFDYSNAYEHHTPIHLKQENPNTNCENGVNENEKSVQTLDIKSEPQEDLPFHFLETSPSFHEQKDDVEHPTDYDSNGTEMAQDDVAEKSISSVVGLKKDKRLRRLRVKRHACAACNRTFDRKSHLDCHLLIHSGLKPYSCDLCNKPFSQKINLDRHMSVHTGEKPFECEICKTAFRQKVGLTKHQLIHTGEKLYSCDQCDKSFTHKHHLISHIRFHTREKPFKCFICNVAFSQQSHLRDHNSIHTKERPYACDLCNKLFALKSHLNRHKLTHNKNNP